MSTNGTGRRVVVTGLGAVTPLGTDVASTLGARSSPVARACRDHPAFDPSRVTSRMAGQVPDFDPSRVLDRKEIRRNDRTTQLALVATAEALADAGLPPRLEGELAEATGVIIGSGLGGTGTLIDQIGTWATRGPDRLSPFFIPMAIANMAAGQAAISFGAMGPNFATTSACASSGHAIGEATEMILRGDAEVMLAGGCEAPVFEATVGAFAAMRALSTRNDDPEGASRPFDTGRDGFVVAEGAATLVLEELGHARRPGRADPTPRCSATARPRTPITSPRRRPVATGRVRAARRALAKSGLDASEIDFVSAHATSTPEGDPAELMAINTLFGERAAIGQRDRDEVLDRAHARRGRRHRDRGHGHGAPGRHRAADAQPARPRPGDGCARPDAPRRPASRRCGSALVNAFGFGGQNSAVVVGRWEDR